MEASQWVEEFLGTILSGFLGGLLVYVAIADFLRKDDNEDILLVKEEIQYFKNILK